MSDQHKDAYGHPTDQFGNKPDGWGNMTAANGNRYNAFGQRIDLYNNPIYGQTPGAANNTVSRNAPLQGNTFYSPIATDNLGCFGSAIGGIISLLIFPPGFFSCCALLFEFIVFATLPYHFISGKLFPFMTFHYNYNPTFGLAAALAGATLFLLINSFILTGFFYALFTSFFWMIWAFNNTNASKIDADGLFNNILKSPIHAFENLFHTMSQGINGWAVYLFIGTLISRIIFSFLLGNVRSLISWQKEIKDYGIIAIVLVLLIGWVLSLHW
jgi:hypothetical protein